MTEPLLSQKTNGSAHLYADSNYGHFSQITESNKHLFPSLSKASPVTFTLEKGDCLYIPAKWWHWVKSFGDRCVAVNYWFTHPLSGTPKLYQGIVQEWPALSKWTNEYLSETAKKSNPDGVWIWRDQFACRQRISMMEFISQHSDPARPKEFAYLITIADYESTLSPTNKFLLEALSVDISFPVLDEPPPKYGFNFWMNFGGIDTGLHYDGEDGLLCVVDGRKEVTLYPPSDSEYLHPYPVEPIILQPNNRNFMYNLYKDISASNPSEQISPTESLKRIDSSSLLSLTLKKAPNLGIYAKKLQERFGIGNIVYGIKNKNGVIAWEFYFYGLDRNCTTFQVRTSMFSKPDYNSHLNLHDYLDFHRATLGGSEKLLEMESVVEKNGLMIYSIDFNEESVMSGELSKINLYYTIKEKTAIPFVLHEQTTYVVDKKTEINSVQYIDLFSAIFASTENFIDACKVVGINHGDVQNLVRFCNGSPYGCRTVGIVNKRTEVGIYFFGVVPSAFMKFLGEYLYPPELTSYILDHLESLAGLQLEIGFHFLKGSSTGIPSRTAFYGLF